jgi:glycerol-3-phosphate dehydrogenase (NAD(P)+)
MTEIKPYRSVAILGAGAWGTALANVAARAGRDVSLWAREPASVAHMRTRRESPRLPGVPLEPEVRPEVSLERAAAADLVLAAVPAQSMRDLARHLAPVLHGGTPVVICAKGIERGTGKFMSEILGECLPDNPPAILSGPSFAADVSRGLPTAVTLAAGDEDLARAIVAALSLPGFRLYRSTDIRGVEIGGATKNVLAIGCGVARGRGLGASAEAALIARGFAELRRFGRAYGAREETLMGLSGLGDLVLTCGSEQSRNFGFGLSLGRGEAPASASHGKLAEGAPTAAVLVELAGRSGVEVPISASVEAIIAGHIGVDEAVDRLLARPSRAEE